MNTMRRLLFTMLVVALLVGALAMPASVVAAPPPHVVGQSATGCFVPADNKLLELTIDGVVKLTIPVDAIKDDAKAGDITLWAIETDEGIQVEIDSVLRRSDFKGQVILQFWGGVESAYEGFNQNDNKKVGDGATIYLDHFSRYSGWF